MTQETRPDETPRAPGTDTAAQDGLGAFLELTSDWLWTTDAAHRFTSIRVGRRLAGQFAPEPCLGKTRRELPWLDVPEGFWDAHQRVLDAHEAFSFVLARRALDGGVHHFEVFGKPLVDGDGRFAGHVGFGRDVSERVQAERRVSESEDRFRDLATLGSDWFWEQDAEFRFTRFDGVDVGKTGTDIARVLGKRRWELDIAGVPAEQWASHRAKLERHEAFSDFEYRIAGDDGALRWVSVSGKPRFGADGTFLGYRGIGREITALKAAQARLRESEQRYRDIAELASDWFWEQDAHFRFVRFSDALPRTAHFASERALGKTRWELDILGVSEAVWRDHRATLDRREPFSDFTYQVRTPEGELRWFQVSGKPYFSESGEFMGYRGAGKDITLRQQAEEEVSRLNATLEERVRQRTAELVASNRELEAFSYSASHDLRTPLRSIEGFAQILAEDYSRQLDSVGHSHLARIRAAAKRMASLIDDLIEMGRLTRTEIQRAEIDLGAIARAVFEEITAAQAAGGTTRLVVHDPVRASADPRVARVLLDNLLSNAWKFTRQAAEPRIEIGVHRRAGVPAYFVRDNGLGFDMRFADKLFQPFQKLHSATDFAGNGIGLATVLRIAQRHGGTAWAEGQPGGGATFHFTLGEGR